MVAATVLGSLSLFNASPLARPPIARVKVLAQEDTHLLWGWPHRFIGRMDKVGTAVFVVRTGASGWIQGIDTAEELGTIAGDNYAGGVWTDRVDVIRPLVAKSY